MGENTSNDKIEQLKYILENVNSWLHFSEAKNAAIIAFNVAMLSSFLSVKWEEMKLLTLFIILILFSTIFAICSFKPITKEIPKCNNDNIGKNLLYYAYISSLDLEEYMRALYQDYWQESDFQIGICSNMEKELCNEIIQNSRITMKKQKWFKNAFYVDAGALVVAIMLVIIA